jgi:uncharacterized membrane protein
MTIGIDVIIAATTAAMTYSTITVAMTAMTGVTTTGVIVAMIVTMMPQRLMWRPTSPRRS